MTYTNAARSLAVLGLGTLVGTLVGTGCLAYPHRLFDEQTGWRAEFHEGKEIDYFRFAPRGGLLLVQSRPSGHDDDFALRVFDSRSMTMLWQRKAAFGRFDPTGKYVIAVSTRSNSYRVVVRRARSGSRVHSFRHHGGIAFSDAGKLALAYPGRIDIVDQRSRKTVQSLKIRGHIYDLQLSVDGSRLAYSTVVWAYAPKLVCTPQRRARVRWSKEIAPPSKGFVRGCFDEYFQSLVRVVHLRSGRVLCSTVFSYTSRISRYSSSFRIDGIASVNLKYLGLRSAVGYALLDVDRCWPVARVPGWGVFDETRRLWAGVEGSRVHVLDLAKAVWRATIRVPIYSRTAVAPDLSRIVGMASPHAVQTLWSIPLAKPRWQPAPTKRRPFRWMSYKSSVKMPVQRHPMRWMRYPRPAKTSTGPEQSWPGAVAHSRDSTVELRARLTHSGVVIQISNPSAQTIEVDWRRTYLISPEGRRLDTVALYRPYTHRCTTGPMDRNPMRLDPGVRHVEELVTLHRRSSNSVRSDLLDPTPFCGQRTTFQVGIITNGKRCEQRTLSFSGVCSTRKGKPHPVFRFHPAVPNPLNR